MNILLALLVCTVQSAIVTPPSGPPPLRVSVIFENVKYGQTTPIFIHVDQSKYLLDFRVAATIVSVHGGDSNEDYYDSGRRSIDPAGYFSTKISDFYFQCDAIEVNWFLIYWWNDVTYSDNGYIRFEPVKDSQTWEVAFQDGVADVPAYTYGSTYGGPLKNYGQFVLSKRRSSYFIDLNWLRYYDDSQTLSCNRAGTDAVLTVANTFDDISGATRDFNLKVNCLGNHTFGFSLKDPLYFVKTTGPKVDKISGTTNIIKFNNERLTDEAMLFVLRVNNFLYAGTTLTASGYFFFTQPLLTNCHEEGQFCLKTSVNAGEEKMAGTEYKQTL